jgi:hypothetical protein
MWKIVVKTMKMARMKKRRKALRALIKMELSKEVLKCNLE